MPSDERVRVALEALAAPLERFRSSLVLTLEEARRVLAATQATAGGRAETLRAELGPFAEGRVDVERLTPLVTDSPALEPAALKRIARATETLQGVVARGEELLRVAVEPGGRLRDVVAAALAQVGRAFGAARVIELAKEGRHRAVEHDAWLVALPFDGWTRAERRLAPPLVVELAGEALRAGGLAEFLDGCVKIVLVVQGECPPAPLVRLITPGTFVLQTVDGSGLERLAAWEGPGVAALVPEVAARFVHEPSAGATPWERLTVEFVPDGKPRRAIGGQSPAQQAEELDQLALLAASPSAAARAGGPAGAAATAAAAAAAPAPDDPAGKLAAWLLRQADLSGTGQGAS